MGVIACILKIFQYSPWLLKVGPWITESSTIGFVKVTENCYEPHVLQVYTRGTQTCPLQNVMAVCAVVQSTVQMFDVANSKAFRPLVFC